MSRKVGGMASTYGFPGDQTPTGTPSEAGMSDGESYSENHENGQLYPGTPNSVSNGDVTKFGGRRTSFDTQDGDGHSLSEMEGM